MDTNNPWIEGPWCLRWDHHPTKRVYFAKWHDAGEKMHIRVWGTGFQGLDDPPPKVVITNTSIGDWTLDLNNEDSSYIIRPDYARELWARLIEMGWQQIDGEGKQL